MDSVRAAAERVRTWFAEHFDPEFENQHPGFLDDVQELLAEHPADSELPVDEEWLRSVGLYGRKSIFVNWSLDCYVSGFELIHVGYRDSEDSLPITDCKTRGAVRRLCEVLGVPLTEKEKP